MASLSDYIASRIRTASGNAVAADIHTGKSAIVNGVVVNGSAVDKKPLSDGNGILLMMKNPSGRVDANFVPYTDSETILINSGLTLTGHTGWVLKDNADAWNSGTFRQYVGATPAAYSVRRKYEVWGRLIDDAMPSTAGVIIYTNYIDVNNYWYSTMRRNTGTGLWYLEIREVNAGVNTQRAITNFNNAVDMPSVFHLTLIEQGDTLVESGFLFETDDSSFDAQEAVYTVGSRPHQDTMKFYFATASGGGDNVQIQGVRVTDLLL